ncbi:hemicentin-2-like [Dreissena polymorpha]|uniref:hemicentin-2-like n=1 Tax=Dreissena polymorpha TaxID=45954 RepID=UPI0022645DC4|nr:hemicentin-2-like [Dreissena polymorpha]
MKASDNNERYGGNESYLNLEILTPPTTPIISYSGYHIAKNITIIDERIYDFYCTSSGKPSPQIYWKLLNNTTEHDVLQIRNVGALHNSTITCCAKNLMIPAVGVPEHGLECTHLNMIVLHKPTFAFNDTYDVKENDSFNVTCTQQNINTVVTWMRQGYEKWSERHNKIYWPDVRRENAGNYTCKLRYSIADSFMHFISNDSEHSFHLNVEYPASVITFEAVGHSDSIVVNENKSMTFRCYATGNPSPMIQIKNNNRVQKQRNAASLGYSENMTCAHTGKYSCYAKNIINDEESKSKDIDVVVKCSPRPASNMSPEFNITTTLHSTVILNFTVIAYPVPKPSDFVWKKCDVEESNGTFNCFLLTDGWQYKISTVDLTSYLTISDFTQHDIGRYMLSVGNGVGDAWNQTFFVWMKAARAVSTLNSDVLLQLIGAGCGTLLLLAATVLVCVCRKRKMQENSVANTRNVALLVCKRRTRHEDQMYITAVGVLEHEPLTASQDQMYITAVGVLEHEPPTASQDQMYITAVGVLEHEPPTASQDQMYITAVGVLEHEPPTASQGNGQLGQSDTSSVSNAVHKCSTFKVLQDSSEVETVAGEEDKHYAEIIDLLVAPTTIPN